MKTNTVLQSIKAIHDKEAADKQLAAEQEHAKHLREQEAFRPIWDIYESVKDVMTTNPIASYANQPPRIPMSKRLYYASTEPYKNRLSFDAYTRFCAYEEGGTMVFTWRINRYDKDHTGTLAEIQAAFIAYLATIIPPDVAKAAN